MIDIDTNAAFSVNRLVLLDALAHPIAQSKGEPRRWFEMKADGDTAEIMIYGEIGKSWWDDDAMSAKQFDDELKALGDGITKINLRINSPGGDAFDGIAIHNTIKAHKAEVTATIDGIAASAASIIAMAADKIVMPQNAFLLIHGASGVAYGNAQDIKALADDLTRLDKSIAATYAARSKQPQTKMASLMKEDRLMDANEAKDLGLADEIKDAVKLAAHYPMRLLPRAAADKLKLVAEETSEEPAPPQAAEGGEEPAASSDDPAPPSNSNKDNPTNVVELKTKAKAEGAAENAKYVDDVLSLCNLAMFPQLAHGYIKNKMPVAEVRKQLVAKRAEEDEKLRINPHRKAEATTAAGPWDRVLGRMGLMKKQ